MNRIKSVFKSLFSGDGYVGDHYMPTYGDVIPFLVSLVAVVVGMNVLKWVVG